MPLKNTATSNRDCDTCVAQPVCRWAEDVRNVESLAERFEFSCKYRIPRQSNSPKEKEACDICGKLSDHLRECQKCHKKVCPDCADVTEMLDVNGGGVDEEVYCPACAKEEW